MVTDATQQMGKAFDTFNDSMRAAVDYTQRSGETWIKMMREAWRQPADFDRAFQRGERIMKEWVPFIGGTMNTLARAYDANFHAGMEVFKSYIDALARAEDTDLGKTTRQVWDATFDAMRTNFDTMTKVGAKTLQNCTTFCEAAFGDDFSGQKPAGRPSPKPERAERPERQTV